MICRERVTLLPLEPGDATRLRELRTTPAVSRLWGPPEPELPDDEPEATRFAMLDGEELAGMIHYGEENTPEYSHAKIDYSSTRPAAGAVRRRSRRWSPTSPGSAGTTASRWTSRWRTRRRSSPTRRPVFAGSE